MKIKFLIIALVFPLALSAQDFMSNANRSLFSDYKANRIGDAVTIIVVESSQASNEAETSVGRSSDLGFSFSGGMDDTALPSIDANVGSRNDFQGGGTTKAGGMVKTKISALIDSVLANGLVRVKGSRKITINGEEQVILIKGLVRTADLSAENEVFSFDISEAEIAFEGSGMIDKNTSPGLLTKLFHWLF